MRHMNRETTLRKDEVVEYFGSQRAVAEALGVSEQAISKWTEFVPRGRAWQLELMTNGKLKAKHSDSSGHALTGS